MLKLKNILFLLLAIVVLASCGGEKAPVNGWHKRDHWYSMPSNWHNRTHPSSSPTF